MTMARLHLGVVLLIVLLTALAAGPARAQTGGISIGIDGGEPPQLTGSRRHARAVPLVNLRPDDQLYPVMLRGWWGHINRQGYLVVPPRYDWTDHSYEGLARAVVDGKTGFLAGNDWRFEPVFPYADRFAEGVAIIGDGEKFGYMDKAGNRIVPIRLDGALRFREDYAAVQIDDRIGYINRAGDLAIPLQFVYARSFHDGVAAVAWPTEGSAPPRFGYIDKRGDTVFADDKPGRITFLGDFNGNLARVRIGRRWGYLDRTYQLRIALRFEDARDFAGHLAAVKLDGQWGYIDRSGEWVIPPRFEVADDFDERLALVAVNERFGYVNRIGEWAIEPQLDWAWPFFRDLARVDRDPSFAYIDTVGNVVWDPRQALEYGIVDVRLAADVRIIADEDVIAHRRFDLPDPREPIPPPYPPDYLYDEGLAVERQTTEPP